MYPPPAVVLPHLQLPNREVRFAAGAGDFAWPVDGRIIQAYGNTARGVRNDGVNIAADEGVVVRASWW